MSNKYIPEPERFASCPQDGNILSYYKGFFESVYVIFHPFFKPKTIKLKTFCPETWPSKHQIINDCEAITWQRAMKLCTFNDINELDIGLIARDGGFKEEPIKVQFGEKLRVLREQSILCPERGYLPPLLENRIFNAIASLDYHWVWIGDEFGIERKLHSLEDIKSQDLVHHHGNIFTYDHTVLVTTHWDCHYSFLCSSKETIEKVLAIEAFEGFYCDEHTDVFWSN